MRILRYIKLILAVVISLGFIKCQDVYVPNDLKNDAQIVVINGGITNDGGPHRITISWATPFLQSIPAYITGAEVTIENNYGQVVFLYEDNPGKYFTKVNELTGIPGESYKLKVLLSNGNQYESEMTIMPEPHNIQTIYAESGEKGFLTENTNGDYFERKYQGLFFYADLNIESGEKKYFRFESLIGEQSYFAIDTMFSESEPPTTLTVRYIDVFYLNRYPDVKATFRDGNRQIIKKHPLGFLPYVEKEKSYNWPYKEGNNLVYKLRRFPTSINGWVNSVQVYSVSPEEYSYYSKVKDQLTATNHIFDPLPSSLRGNIKCITDDKEPVFGYFNVASKSVFSRAVKWWPGTTIVTYRDVDDYPYTEPVSVMDDVTFPPGWVNY